MLSVILVAIPLGIAFYLYHAERVEQATMRNFRALGNAALRIQELRENVPRVAYNKHLGFAHVASAQHAQGIWPERLVKQMADGVDLDRGGQEQSLWEVVAKFQETHGKGQASLGRLDALSLVARRLEPGLISEHCADNLDCRRELVTVNEGACTGTARRLVDTDEGVALEIDDCRRFEDRARQLYNALQSIAESRARELKAVVAVQNLFGVRHRVSLAAALEQVTTHLHSFFDGYMVVDGSGRAIYEGTKDLGGVLGPRSYVRHRETAPFAALVNLSELLEHEQSGSLFQGTEMASDTGRGLSVVKRVAVGDVELRVFVHPFTLPNTEPLAGESTELSPYYMVGVVREGVLQRMAFQFPSTYVANVALLIFAVLLLLPVIWLASVGDRLVLGAWKLIGVIVSGALSVIVVTTVATGASMIKRDDLVLDEVLRDTAQRMRDGFLTELDVRLRRLLEEGGKLGKRQVAGIDGHIYCGGETAAPPSAKDGLGLPVLDVAFLMDPEGRQIDCLDWRSTPTRKLDLKFREYFKGPSQAVMWWMPAERKAAGVGTDEPTEYVSPAFQCLRGSFPFFIERIYSVVRNTKSTIISLPAKHPCAPSSSARDAGEVLAAVVHFPSLENERLPLGVHYSVVDGDTGATLFDSQADRALVTNFVDDVGRDAGLLRAFGMNAAEDANFLSLAYNGVPVRAYVLPLGETPWKLVVYRDYELQTNTSTEATRYTLPRLLLLVGVFGLLVAALGRVAAGPAFVRRGIEWAYGAGGLVVASVALLPGAYGSLYPLTSLTSLGTFTFLTFVSLLLLLLAVGFVLSYYDGWRPFSASRSRRERGRRRRPFRRRPQRARRFARWGLGSLVAGTLAVVSVLPAPLLLESVASRYARQAAKELGCSLVAQGDELREDARERAGRYRGGDKLSERWELAHFPTGTEDARRHRESAAGSNCTTAEVHAASFSDAVRDVLGEGSDASQSEVDVGSLELLDLAFSALVVVLIGWISWVVARVIALGDGSARLPVWRSQTVRGRERLLLVCRSSREWNRAREELLACHGVTYVARRTESGWRWQESGAYTREQARRSLYLVEDFDLVRDLDDSGLLELLEERVAADVSIVLCGRTVASYQLAELASLDPEHLPRERVRWARVLGGFAAYLAARETICLELESPPNRVVHDVLEAEVVANPDLIDAAEALARDIGGKGGRWTGAAVVAAFRRQAESFFAGQWDRSMLDERLQLYTLAHDGFANCTQREALASLSNRGMIEGFGEAGLLRLSSAAFGDYVRALTHDDLLAWRNEGHHNNWRAIWPVIGTLAVLAIAFISQASPQAVAMALAALTGVAGLSPLRSLTTRRPLSDPIDEGGS